MLRVAGALAQVKGTDQSGNTAGDMNDRSAGKVEDRPAATSDVQHSAYAPDHMGHGAVDEQRPERKKYRHGAEPDALGKGPSNQGRRDDGKHHLVNHEGLLGDGAAVVGVGRERDAAQEDVLKAADEAVSCSKCQRIAHQRPQNRDEPHHGETLHHGAQNVLAADQAAIKESQTRSRHQQHQCGGDQHPGIISRGLGIANGLLKDGDLGLCGGRRRAKIGSHGHGHGRESEAGKENQQRYCATTHRIPLPG